MRDLQLWWCCLRLCAIVHGTLVRIRVHVATDLFHHLDCSQFVVICRVSRAGRFLFVAAIATSFQIAGVVQ